MSQAFFLSEAVLCTALLFIALSALPAFSVPYGGEAQLQSCNDAAGVLLKMSAFEDEERLSDSVEQLNRVSGFCISAKADSWAAGDCPSSGETVAFSFPAISGGKVRKAVVSCSFP